VSKINPKTHSFSKGRSTYCGYNVAISHYGISIQGEIVYSYRGSKIFGSEVQGSAFPPAQRTAGQIEKETLLSCNGYF
jgi:hypothetical protein